jgi:hypothetical protein
MTFEEVRVGILNNEHFCAQIKFNTTIIRISKTPHPFLRQCKYAVRGGLLWEISETVNKKTNRQYITFKEIPEQVWTECINNWEFYI